MGDKTWTVVGTSLKRGERKLRLANGTAAARQKVLENDDHAEVRLFDLPRPMTAAEAEAWLREQGDAVPEHKPAVAKPVVVRPNRVERAVQELVKHATELAHEDLGRAWHKNQHLSFIAWEDLRLETREEYCRNAAWAAGIPCPKGTFPTIEALLAKEGVVFGPLGEMA